MHYQIKPPTGHIVKTVAFGTFAVLTGAFAILRKATISFDIRLSVCLSVCLSVPLIPSVQPPAWNNTTHSGRIFIKFVIQ